MIEVATPLDELRIVIERFYQFGIRQINVAVTGRTLELYGHGKDGQSLRYVPEIDEKQSRKGGFNCHFWRLSECCPSGSRHAWPTEELRRLAGALRNEHRTYSCENPKVSDGVRAASNIVTIADDRFRCSKSSVSIPEAEEIEPHPAFSGDELWSGTLHGDLLERLLGLSDWTLPYEDKEGLNFLHMQFDQYACRCCVSVGPAAIRLAGECCGTRKQPVKFAVASHLAGYVFDSCHARIDPEDHLSCLRPETVGMQVFTGRACLRLGNWTFYLPVMPEMPVDARIENVFAPFEGGLRVRINHQQVMEIINNAINLHDDRFETTRSSAVRIFIAAEHGTHYMNFSDGNWSDRTVCKDPAGEGRYSGKERFFLFEKKISSFGGVEGFFAPRLLEALSAVNAEVLYDRPDRQSTVVFIFRREEEGKKTPLIIEGEFGKAAIMPIKTEGDLSK